MAYTIISESYGPRKPKIICTADSLDDLAGLDCAEGSEATVGGTKYVLDRVNGWVEPGGGGSGLPAVTSSDNGDVLTVVEGAWGKAAPSGGALTVNVTMDYNADEQPVYTCDQTAATMYAAAPNVVFVYDDETYNEVGSLTCFLLTMGSYIFGARFPTGSPSEMIFTAANSADCPSYTPEE